MELFKKVVAEALPDVLRETVNIIRFANITSVDSNAQTITASITGTGEVLNNVSYQSGATNINVGNRCLILSPDPKNKNVNYAIIF